MPADKNFCQFLEVLTCRNHLGEIGSDWARHSKDPWAGYYTQFSLWVFLNRILSQAQTATQKLFWHNSVWIWQSIWKCLSESPHPKCNYHRICCEAVCDEQAASPVLVPRSLPPILYPQAAAFHAVWLVITLKLLDPMRRLAANADLWLKQKPGDQWLPPKHQSPCRSRERMGARQFMMVSVLGTHRRCSVSTTATLSWTFCQWQIERIWLDLIFLPHGQFIIFLINVCILSRYLGILLTLASHLLVIFYIVH